MAYAFKQIEAHDPNNPGLVAPNASVTIFEPGDPTKTPLTLTTLAGDPLPNPVTVNGLGYGPAFMHATLPQVAWAGGGLTGTFESYEGMRDEAIAARAAAETAQAQAENAVSLAETAAQAPTDAAVDAGIERANLPAVAAAAVAADATVAAAAEGAVASAVTNLKIRQILEYGPGQLAATSTAFTTLRGTPTYTSGNAKFGGAGFAGGVLSASTIDDFTDGPATSNTFTAEAWVKTTDTGLRGFFDRDGRWWLGADNGALKLFYKRSSDGGTDVISGGTGLADGNWHHVAIVFSADGIPSLYLDGVRVVVGANTAFNQATTQPFLIGAGDLGASAYDWAGAIDEFRLSNSIRYTGTSFTPPTTPFTPDLNTKALAHFDDGTWNTYTSGTGYPTRPVGSNVRVEWVGPTTPPEMAVGDTWIEVPA